MCTNMKIGGHKTTVLSITPTATLEDNVLCIYTEKALENARITVADAQGNVWFDAEESSLSGSYSFTLDGSL